MHHAPHGMGVRHEPQGIEAQDFDTRAAQAKQLLLHGQPAVGEQKRQGGKNHPAHAGNAQGIQQRDTKMAVALLLLAPGLGPEEQPGGDHHTAAQSAKEVQPAQGVVAELDVVQAGDEVPGVHRG